MVLWLDDGMVDESERGLIEVDEGEAFVVDLDRIDPEQYELVGGEEWIVLADLVDALGEPKASLVTVTWTGEAKGKPLQDGQITDDEYADWGVDIRDQTDAPPKKTCITWGSFTVCV
jgi:hypothetical protein